MANFIVTYDLNGPRPSHKEMDEHLKALGPEFLRGRILETVWYVAGPTHSLPLRNYVQRILGPEDLLLVVEARNATWTKLLVDEAAFKAVFDAQPLAA
jgi:hypothetical protein